MSILRFCALIKIHGVNPYVLVSAKRAAELKARWRKPMPVLVRINGKPDEPHSTPSRRSVAQGKPWPISMMPVGDGSFRLYLHETVRKASNTGVGDRVEVEVRFDAKYKSGAAHPMPAWFSEALKKDPTAKKNWEALIPSRKKEILRYFAALKSVEARERNLDRALNALSGSSVRFMARSWNGGK